MNDARAQRPTPGPTAAMFLSARMALSDAQAAGDPQYAARVLMQCAARLAAYDHAWTTVRPPLGVRRHDGDSYCYCCNDPRPPSVTDDIYWCEECIGEIR